jgi:hypothetical protein
MRRFLITTAIVLLPAPARAADDALAAALKAKAPAVVAHLKAKGFTNVGVLKFLVRQGEEEARDNAGDLNRSLANKLQVALCLALKPDDTFGIIHDPSAVVVKEQMTRANHRSKDDDGRKAFFERKYGLVWSGDKVVPSGFIAGTAVLAKDLTTITLRLQAFDKSGIVWDIPVQIEAPADPEELAQAGYSFTLAPVVQKALVTGEPPPPPAVLKKEAVKEMVRTAGKRKPEPAAAPFQPLADCPVRWEIRYNGKPLAVTGDSVPEPAETDKVTFVLRNPGPGTYAAVLLVNGANTLYEERTAPVACRKWVLPPNSEVEVRGFQVEHNKVLPFKVLPPEAAEEDVVRYGDNAGTYRLVVYAGSLTTGKSDPNEVLVKADRDESVIALARGSAAPSGAKPQTLAELQNELRGRTKAAEFGRGYVGKGTAGERSETEVVQFKMATTVPVSDVTLRYFTPKR